MTWKAIEMTSEAKKEYMKLWREKNREERHNVAVSDKAAPGGTP